ncbi:SDR family oxidoreductase [beta proteobacterium MWH-UniP1]
MKTATVFGASGGLAHALCQELLAQGWQVDAVSRSARAARVQQTFAAHIASGQMRLSLVQDRYSEFTFSRSNDAVFLTQALFEPMPLAAMTAQGVSDEVTVGLTDPMNLVRSFLHAFPSVPGMRRNICFVGSTSAYAGFENTSVYCALKHGLLGFVRALNQEYAATDDRFWLFSMGTMHTEMGRKVLGQDSSSYLNPLDVAQRMVSAIADPSNVFEPEVIMRRRTIKFLEP